MMPHCAVSSFAVEIWANFEAYRKMGTTKEEKKMLVLFKLPRKENGFPIDSEDEV